MSRSRKKTPIAGNCGHSEKYDKQIANRKFRRREKVKVDSGWEPPYRLEEVSCTWWFSKDGRQSYWGRERELQVQRWMGK